MAVIVGHTFCKNTKWVGLDLLTLNFNDIELHKMYDDKFVSTTLV